MKANEAPEKIYLTPLECMAASYQPKRNNTIEYIRTDAFIKEACEWIISNMDDYIHVEYDTTTGKPTNEAHIAHKKVIEDFKNAMKG